MRGLGAPEELIVSAEHPKLAGLAFGPKTGKPVLALHGWLDNAASFLPLTELLQPGLRFVALDLPGHGKSEHRSPDASYPFTDWVRDVFRAADALGWQRFSLVGHSLGAAVASMAAGTFPERIDALALLEGIGPLTAPAEEAGERLAVHLAASVRLKTKRLPLYKTEAEALRARAEAGDFADPKSILPVVRRGLKTVDGHLTWSSDPRLKLPSALRLTEPQALAFLKRIRCQTMIVRAEKGLLASDSVLFERFRQAIEDCALHELPGGHHLHLDDPAPVAALLNRFLAAK